LSSTPESASDLSAGPDRRFLALALIGGLSALAWGAIALWNASPYARYLDHGRWLDPVWFDALCRALPQGQLLVPALLYAAAWLLMILAMMLPTTLPLLGVFARITMARADRGALLALCVLGYVLAWSGFGLVAYAADSAVHVAASRSGWLTAHGWAIGALVLAGAGAFQFSSLKYRCLERCRTPFGFVNSRWRGLAPGREALRIGFDHGLFCVGCCWALMLVMFVVGMGNLGWMLLLAALMAAEKNLPVGRRLAAPVGAGLLASAGLLVLANLG
jgi:predicted metal-binding membrane protein